MLLDMMESGRSDGWMSRVGRWPAACHLGFTSFTWGRQAQASSQMVGRRSHDHFDWMSAIAKALAIESCGSIPSASHLCNLRLTRKSMFFFVLRAAMHVSCHTCSCGPCAKLTASSLSQRPHVVCSRRLALHTTSRVVRIRHNDVDCSRPHSFLFVVSSRVSIFR